MINFEGASAGLAELGRGLAEFTVGALAPLLAIVAMAIAISRAIGKSKGDSSVKAAGIFVPMIISGLLWNYGDTMSQAYETMTGTAGMQTFAAVDYTPPGSAMPAWGKAMLDATLTALAGFGWVAGLHGLWKWKLASEGNGSHHDLFWGGFWMLFGGAALVNISHFLTTIIG